MGPNIADSPIVDVKPDIKLPELQEFDDDDDDWDELSFGLSDIDDDRIVFNGRATICTCETSPDICRRARKRKRDDLYASDFKCENGNFFNPCYKSRDVKSLLPNAQALQNIVMNVVDGGKFALDCLYPNSDTTINLVYEVEQIILKKVERGITQALIQWKDYGFNEMTWERYSELQGCTLIKKEFDDRMHDLKLVASTIERIREDFPGYEKLYADGHLTPPALYARIAEYHYNKVYTEKGRAPIIVENWTNHKAELTVEFVTTSIFSTATIQALKEAGRKATPRHRYQYLINAVFDSTEKKPIYEKKLKRAIDTPSGLCCPCDECKFTECPCMNKYFKESYMATSHPNHYTECHKSCRCKKNKKKMPMFGCNIRIMLFYTNNAGWSVRTLQNIESNVYVMEYVGIVCLATETKQCRDDSYLFDCQPPSEVFCTQRDRDYRGTGTIVSPKYVIDATNHGDVSRFINHSCEPNLYACTVQGHENDPLYVRVIFRSTRAIAAGEELTFNYFDSDIHFADVEITSPQCHCGAANCRRYLITTVNK